MSCGRIIAFLEHCIFGSVYSYALSHLSNMYFSPIPAFALTPPRGITNELWTHQA